MCSYGDWAATRRNTGERLELWLQHATARRAVLSANGHVSRTIGLFLPSKSAMAEPVKPIRPCCVEQVACDEFADQLEVSDPVLEGRFADYEFLGPMLDGSFIFNIDG